MEAQIARCHERIEDGILPVVFEHKLITLNAEKETREYVSMSQGPHTPIKIILTLL